MGLFDRIFSKKKVTKAPETKKTIDQSVPVTPGQEKLVEPPVPFQAINVAVMVEHKHEEQEPVGYLSHLDFGKPAGELGRFLIYRKYKVTGIDEQGKRKIKLCTGVDSQQAIEKAANEGLLPPFETEPMEYDPPTERQLNYLKNLGVVIPDNITKDDAINMISRVVGEDSEEGPHPSLVALAMGLKTEFSAFVGASGLLRAIIGQSRDRDLAALYAYGVRQSMRGGLFRNMLDDPDLPAFYAFADMVVADPALMRSLRGRTADDFKSPHHGTAIYKAATAYLERGSTK